jgi:Asp/Glu/hydantoin racemase
MNKSVALIHATRVAIEPTHSALQQAIPSVEITHYLDEALLKVAGERGVKSPEVLRRFNRMLISAEEGGAAVVLMTCSSLIEAADLLAPLVRIPIVKIDTPMLERAISIGGKIGVVATLPSAVSPAREQLENISRERGVELEPKFVVVEGAFQALLDNDSERHDHLVMEQIRALAQNCDVVILAQASISGVAAREDLKVTVPVLTSPPLAAARVKEILERT